MVSTPALLLTLAGAASLCAQPNFNSGSSGAYGAMNITTNTTLDLPPDGIFHCTTINVAGGATLRFNRNSLNTPVYLLATGDVTISGWIDVSGFGYDAATPGAGGPGGFEGGYAGFGSGPSAVGGEGQGAGGGRKTLNSYGGAFAQPAAVNSNVYGNALLSPLIGGSGGAGSDGSPGYSGGGGGGAILVASSTQVRVTAGGRILANGGPGAYGGGSGGGVRLVAPVVAGNGLIQAAGGSYVFVFLGNGLGSPGRIRIDTLDRYAYRQLTVAAGVFSHGSQMFVFPSNSNRLDIVQVGTQSIALGTTNAVTIDLPAGPSTNLNVSVRASGFTNDVPIRVVVTPENGSATRYDTNIVTSGSPATLAVNVTIPAGTISRIHAWTR